MGERIVIIGAGPAGLTAAYELLSRGGDYQVTVLEESEYMGGISRTVLHNGNRMDMGGHRFFSKAASVNEWWEKMLPTQGAPSMDDIMLTRKPTIKEGGPNPETENRVMLRRNRVSRILFDGKFFDYPISLKFETFKNMGLSTTVVAGFSYLKTVFVKRPVNSLEDYYINSFGKKLYSMFFENYTENLWGRHPSEIDPSWGAQRTKDLSIFTILKNAIQRQFNIKSKEVQTSLIEEFAYPKLGPGQLWEVTAEEIKKLGGTIITSAQAVGFGSDNGRIASVTYEKDGRSTVLDADIFISSMPIKDLIGGMENVPEDIAAAAAGLPYRDYITLGVLIPSINLKNKTGIKTVGNIIPDNWIYVHDRTVKMGRFQIYNNWSPYLVKDLENTLWIGLEYFCTEGDSMWNMTDESFAQMAMEEMVILGLIDSVERVMDYHVERVKKAYPAYFDTYSEIDSLRKYLDSFGNLYCVGRNGQHRYNNIDHSMVTSFETVNNIISGRADKANVWSVNTEQEYHEKE